MEAEISEYGLSLVCNSYLTSETGVWYNLGMEAHLFRPDDTPFGSGTNGAYKPSLYIDGRGFDPNPVSGTYKCETDNYVEGQWIGKSISTINIIVLLPSYLTVISDGYLTQEFDNYNREIFYQAKNQFDDDLTIPNLSVSESYSPISNSCNRSPIQTGSASTNSIGRFKDNYWVQGSGTPGCQEDPQCTTAATQTIRVANILVRTNEVTFGCNGVTIVPQ